MCFVAELEMGNVFLRVGDDGVGQPRTKRGFEGAEQRFHHVSASGKANSFNPNGLLRRFCTIGPKDPGKQATVLEP